MESNVGIWPVNFFNFSYSRFFFLFFFLLFGKLENFINKILLSVHDYNCFLTAFNWTEYKFSSLGIFCQKEQVFSPLSCNGHYIKKIEN
jgi:hypothetical protein